MFSHRPVLLEECIQALNIRPDGVYLDGTLGRAGHSREIARRLTTGRLICVDRDQAALDAARERLAEWMDRVTLVHSNFDRVGAHPGRSWGCPARTGCSLTWGCPPPSWTTAARGFSYMADAPLDMRMDRAEGLTAADVVNTWTQEELRRILLQYGEERYAPQIAAAIVRRRTEQAHPHHPGAGGGHQGGHARQGAARRSSTRPSAAFRPSASRSTTSWAAWSGCSGGRCPG